MHEVSAAGRIISIASSQAQKRGFSRVKSIRVRIGAWSCINPESLRSAFAAASDEGPAAGARLDIEIVSPHCVCEECGAAFEPEGFKLRCQKCGSVRVVLRQGRELEVESIEV